MKSLVSHGERHGRIAGGRQRDQGGGGARIGSFTAEQFVLLLQLFNVSVSNFVADGRSTESQLYNALARLGAAHVRESNDVVPSERLDEVNRVVVEVLVDGSARLLTALAPVVVNNIDRIGLRRIESELANLGAWSITILSLSDSSWPSTCGLATRGPKNCPNMSPT